jgi:hypothetical protein
MRSPAPSPLPVPFSPPTDAVTAVLRRWQKAPLLFVTEALGIEPHPWQRRVLDWLAAGETRISVRSGHGVGKTALEAWLALWFPLTRDDAKVGITAPAGPQIEVNLWPELRKWLPRLREGSPIGAWLADHLHIQELEIKFENGSLVRASHGAAGPARGAARPARGQRADPDRRGQRHRRAHVRGQHRRAVDARRHPGAVQQPHARHRLLPPHAARAG